MSKYCRMTLAARCQIDLLMQEGMSYSKIAKRVKFHRSSIYREIHRNFYGNSYEPTRAQKLSKERYVECRRHYKITPEKSERLKHYLRIGWSPEQISGRFLREKYFQISHECIYQFVRKNPGLRPYLRRPRKYGFSRYSKTICAPKNGKSITKRPHIVAKRSRFGDWERDLFYGAKRKQFLVCAERKSRFIKISKLSSIDSKTVGNRTEELINSLPRRAHTMTNDNGTEFKGQAINIPTYFCEPRRPQQRGTIENTIGLIRQYISLKTNVDEISDERVSELENTLNQRPRKVLNYRTPHEVFFKTIVALAN